MNWGTKLALGLATFMTFIVVLGILMIRSNDDALVDKDYYEKGINYNKDYDRKENVKRDHAEPLVILKEDNIVLTFSQQAAGKVKLIRTADKKMDKLMKLQTDTAKQFLIPVAGKAKGLWKLQLEWNSNGKDYLFEKEVML